MAQEEVIKDLVEQTYRELARPKQPVQDSRIWKSPVGYRYLVPWSNAVLLRYFVRLFTKSLPKSEYRRKAQVDDASRSVVRNIEEGYKRATTSEYLDFIGYSQGSLEEVRGDIRELTEDGFLPSKNGSSLERIGIDLGKFNQVLRPKKPELEEDKGIYRNLKEKTSDRDEDFLYRPITVLYPPLDKVVVQDLTYEIFAELINKTDYLLRGLVSSLEKKLTTDKKSYQIDQARIRDKFRR